MGISTTKIASLLGISTATVRTHVKSPVIKLGLHSPVEAVSVILRSNGGPLRSETADVANPAQGTVSSTSRPRLPCWVEHRIDVGFEAITP